MPKSKREQKNSKQLNLDLNSFLLMSAEVKESNVICFQTAQKQVNQPNNAVLQRLLKEAKAISW
jgi:hypothetical protein